MCSVQEYSLFIYNYNIGSILSVMDENGTKVFDASCDAWGKQTITLNAIGLHRGYMGHEMLGELDIINMNQRSLSRSGESNGRLYDPVLGRFFSPGNYVQMPDNSQNFNRYSYCLNNPLKYTDPSGNLFGIDDAVIAFAAFSMGSSMMQASFEGKSVWKAGALSLLSSAASYGIGEAFKNVASTFGNELLRAGAHGLASGVVSALDGGNFVSSFVSGAAASGMGSYAQSVDMNTGLMVASTTAMGGVVAWAIGDDFLEGAMQGMAIGVLNHAQHDLCDPVNDQEAAKNKSRDLIKKDPKYKQKIISEIQRDGKLSFGEAFYWYGYGDGSPIRVDASKLDLGTIPIGKHKIDRWSVQTAALSGNYKVGVVYGSISVMYLGNNNFKILPDIYDFDLYWKMGWRTLIRNLETIGARYLHGTGTPFKIIFNGLYHNKK